MTRFEYRSHLQTRRNRNTVRTKHINYQAEYSSNLLSEVSPYLRNRTRRQWKPKIGMIASQVLRNYINLIYHDCSQNAYSCRIPISSLPTVKAPPALGYNADDRAPDPTRKRSQAWGNNIQRWSYIATLFSVTSAPSHICVMLWKSMQVATFMIFCWCGMWASMQVKLQVGTQVEVRAVK